MVDKALGRLESVSHISGQENQFTGASDLNIEEDFWK